MYGNLSSTQNILIHSVFSLNNLSDLLERGMSPILPLQTDRLLLREYRQIHGTGRDYLHCAVLDWEWTEKHPPENGEINE